MIRILLFLILACMTPANAHINIDLGINLEPEYDDTYASELEPFMPRGLKVSYLSSVIVQVSDNGITKGLGSGNYFKLGTSRFILTAAHVVDEGNEVWIMEKGYTMTLADVVYQDDIADTAILIPRERLRYTKAIPFRRDINNQMGEKIYHCGHPARESFHISEGLLTGTHRDTLLVNTFVWPGSSGSVLFDESGRVLGIISAIRVDVPFGQPQMIEHIVLVSNIKMLDQETLRTVLENEK